ncbi:MAG: Gfo/Idh/MocA family oxidoreductase [Acidobacteria bacterium]|nr:Gfo/Idh/MocA family oxidoreductase [Acidobacteriota bacterium]MCI0719796.1 Gfo/Idh/MocA family oxidoreductase [Acidobacteriota bacterium]
MSRRGFIQSSVAAGMANYALPILGEPAGEKHRTALIGAGWWGMNILGEAMASGQCQVVALCDVDERQLNPATDKVNQLSGDSPRKYRDYRELLDKEKPAIVIVGTPDHWHPLIMIAAVKAGAHVYVEKPIGHTIQEGRAMVNAARAAGKVVQVGTHRRVSPHNVSGREFIRSGRLGKIGMVRAFVHYGGGPETPLKNVEPPKSLDWNLWCGPAPLRPYNGDAGEIKVPRGAIHTRGFRNYLDYANGTLGDWGIHWMDQILWITGEKWPRKVSSYGGRAIKGPAILTKEEQTSDAPDHQVAIYDFENFTVSWEHRQFAANNAEKGENVGCYFYGTEGTFHMGWQKGWTFYPADAKKPVLQEEAKLNSPDAQNIKELWQDFLDAIKTGRRPISDIEEIHRSTNVSLLGMLALKLGRSVQWDGAKEVIVGDAEANKLLRRAYRGPWEYPTG